jgi:hypothetical protein
MLLNFKGLSVLDTVVIISMTGIFLPEQEYQSVGAAKTVIQHMLNFKN